MIGQDIEMTRGPYRGKRGVIVGTPARASTEAYEVALEGVEWHIITVPANYRAVEQQQKQSA